MSKVTLASPPTSDRQLLRVASTTSICHVPVPFSSKFELAGTPMRHTSPLPNRAHPRIFNCLFEAIDRLDYVAVDRICRGSPQAGLIDQRNQLGESPLVFAANQLERGGTPFRIVQILVEAGADMSTSDCFKDTPMQAAARAKHSQAVHYLLDHNCSLHGRTPLFAQRWLSVELARSILQRGDVDAMKWLNEADTLGAGLQPLHVAAARRDHRKMRLYVEMGANPLALTRASRMTPLALLHRAWRHREVTTGDQQSADLLRRHQLVWIHEWTPQRHRYLNAKFRRRAAVLMMVIRRVLPPEVRFPRDLKKLLVGALMRASYRM